MQQVQAPCVYLASDAWRLAYAGNVARRHSAHYSRMHVCAPARRMHVLHSDMVVKAKGEGLV